METLRTNDKRSAPAAEQAHSQIFTDKEKNSNKYV